MVFEPYYHNIGTFSPNLSQNGQKLYAYELNVRAPNFLKNSFVKKSKTVSEAFFLLKQQSVKVITCGLQANNSVYFITIALKC